MPVSRQRSPSSQTDGEQNAGSLLAAQLGCLGSLAHGESLTSAAFGILPPTGLAYVLLVH